MVVFFRRIFGGAVLGESFPQLVGNVFEERTIRILFLIGLYGEAGLLVILRGSVVDLLEDRELVHTSLELVHE